MDGRKARLEVSVAQCGQTRCTRLLLTVTSTTLRDKVQVTGLTVRRAGDHFGRPRPVIRSEPPVCATPSTSSRRFCPISPSTGSFSPLAGHLDEEVAGVDPRTSPAAGSRTARPRSAPSRGRCPGRCGRRSSGVVAGRGPLERRGRRERPHGFGGIPCGPRVEASSRGTRPPRTQGPAAP